jgi:hypothetical protein
MHQLKQLFYFNKTPIYRLENPSVTFFQKGMAIDADGCPRAYHPDNTGLDDLKHGGYEGNWWGIATQDGSAGGKPIIQKDGDPAPGHYVSATSLINSNYPIQDTRRYVDAASIPYFVLPERFLERVKLGDLAWIYNTKNKKSCFAIFADVGPDVGEGSIYLAGQIGVDNDPRYGGVGDGIMYFIFNGSGKGNGFHLTKKEIKENGQKLLKDIPATELVALFENINNS